MQKVVPFIGLAIAVGVGVALAPVLGWLLALAAVCLVGYGIILLVRPLTPILIPIAWLAGAACGIWALVAAPDSTIAGAARLFIVIMVLQVVWRLLTAAFRWFERAA